MNDAYNHLQRFMDTIAQMHQLEYGGCRRLRAAEILNGWIGPQHAEQYRRALVDMNAAGDAMYALDTGGLMRLGHVSITKFEVKCGR